MTLVLLVPGVGMGAGTAASGGSTALVLAVHKRVGVLQPDVPVVGGGHGTA
jgi:hypothetical protein